MLKNIPTCKDHGSFFRALARGAARLLILGAASLLLLVPAHASNLSGQGASPNPFSPPVSTNTTLSYTLGVAAMTWIDIYNAGGTLQRDLLTPSPLTATNKAAGANTTTWDGKNNAAAFVADGLYNYKINDAWFSASYTPIGSNPHDIAVDPSNANNMWMLDKAASKYVQKSTNGGANWTAVTTTGADAKAWGIVISSDGQKIYIANDGQTGLLKSTDAGANWGITSAFPSSRTNVSDVAIDSAGTIVYALNGVYASPVIFRSANGGTSWTTCAMTGVSPALISGAGGVATDAAGTTVIVLDSATDTVWKSTDSCASFSKVTAITSGTAAGQVSWPYHVSIQSDGSYWISEQNNHRIQQFDANGNSLMVIGGTSSGSGNYQFNSGSTDLGIGLATISGQPYIFVADYSNNRIQKIGYDNWASTTDITIDTVAPTSTITSGSYDEATNTLTITGTNFTTIDVAGTDIKSYVNWTKFVWDINGDDATTANVTFVLGDVTSLTITNATTLTLVLTAAKGTALEGTAGYGTAPTADTLDVTAGFIKDQAGNAATTDVKANAPLTIIAPPTTTIGDGATPASRNVGRSTTNRAVDAFTLSTNTGTDTLTGLTVTLSGTGAAADIAASGVKIWKDNGTVPNEWDAGDTQIGSGVSMSGATATFSGLTEGITTTSTQYLITYDISAAATPGNTLLGAVTAATTTNALTNNDTADNTLTVAAVAGTVYTDEGTTNIGSGKSVKLVKAGVAGNSDTTDAFGRYAITATLAAGNAILVYIDNDAIYDANTVTLVGGTAIAGLDLYAGHVITRCDNACSLSIANMSTALGAYTDAGDLLYSMTGSLTVSGTTTSIYIPTGHTFAPGAAITVTPAMDIRGTFTAGAFTHTLSGTGTPLSVTGTFTSTGSTIKYTGTTTATNITATNYNNLQLTPTGATTYSLTGNLTGGNAMTGSLTIDANATLDATTANNYNLTGVSATINASGVYLAKASTITLSGDFSNGGTFTAGTSVVVLNGTNQAITGSTTFNDLTKSVATARTLTFASGSTTTVNGIATLNGASGQLLSLVSSTPGTYWNFNLGAASTKTISYVSVTDSDASGSNAAKIPVNPTNSTDGGHTLAWFVPSLTFLKTVAVTSDPVNGATNPKYIPGAEVLYTMRVTNSGIGPVDNNTLVITDPIPTNTELFTGNLSGGAPFVFTNGAPSSGLSCAFAGLGDLADCMDFSSNGGSTWTKVPNGSFDSTVTNIRFSLSGTMNGTGGGSPYFDLSFRVRVK